MTEPEEPRVDQFGMDIVDFTDNDIFTVGGISDGRWERARSAVDVRDLLQDLYGVHGNPISCPFHGSDRKPSFYVYPKANDCFCFGCGEGDGYWDTIKIVARHHGWTVGERDDRAQAVRWLEQHYPMPALTADQEWVKPDMIIVEELDEGEEAEVVDPYALLKVADLQEPYLREAIRQVREFAASSNAELAAAAQDHLERYFRALKHDNPIPLVQLIGAEVTRNILRGSSATPKHKES